MVKNFSRMLSVVTLVTLLGGVLAGCTKKEAQAKDVAQSEAQREGAPEVSAVEMAELVSGNSALALDSSSAVTPSLAIRAHSSRITAIASPIRSLAEDTLPRYRFA